MRAKHIVYDCDGTLVSTMGAVYHLMQDFFSSKLNRSISRDEVIQNLNYDNKIMLKNFGLPENLAGEIENAWIQFSTHQEENFDLFDGVITCLSHFSNDKFHQYIWTGRDRASTEKIVKFHNLEPIFKDMYCRDDGHAKPSVLGLAKMLNGVNPRDVVIIGDTYADMLGAKNFKAFALGAAWCENADEDILKKYGADSIIKNPNDLIEAIEKIFS